MHRGECVTTGGLYRPTHLCVAHWIAQKSLHFVLWCGRLGDVWRGWGMVHVSGGRGLHGVSEAGGVIWVQGSHSLGEKAVEQSGGAGSDAPGTVFLMVGAGRDCGRGGWGPSRCCWFCWSIVQGKCPGWMGEGHRWSLQPCSLSAGGSCGQQHCSSRTRQWCS